LETGTHVEDSEDLDMKMEETEVYDYARRLLEARGAQAVVEAAQKACAFEQQRNKEEAETWRHIEAVLKQMRGPHES
jgi:hypothetical protein